MLYEGIKTHWMQNDYKIVTIYKWKMRGLEMILTLKYKFQVLWLAARRDVSTILLINFTVSSHFFRFIFLKHSLTQATYPSHKMNIHVYHGSLTQYHTSPH